MKKIYYLLLCALIPIYASAYTQTRVSVHDPSIVWEPTSETYYVFGSHQSWAKSTDLMNWTSVPVAWRTTSSPSVTCETAFNTNATTSIKVGGVNRSFGNFDVEAFSAAGYVQVDPKNDPATYQISGNLWAPDVIWNKKMEKWCMYLSINGQNANCSIVLLTSDNIEGPYLYQGPIVFSGFNIGSSLSYKYTDLELALGTQATLPDRYNVGSLTNWRHRWPNAIDPCVFYDESGKLWMSYGSWHGGIWMLELDEETGLRDYDVEYSYTQGSNDDDVRVDPYFGKKIAGGFQVSGEASYIKYIDGYYYLFITYGGLEVNGGYQMRVFRSANPDGPYTDTFNGEGVAVYNAARVNYGPDGTRKTNRGENIFGAYGEWGYTTRGDYSERSQGHNSFITNKDQTFLVYHTRFQNRGDGHEVRVHQMFVNKDKWLCAAPFEYTGETVTNTDIKTTQQVATADIPGTYKILLHDKNLDHANKELKIPVIVELNSDGTITGDKTGTWSITSGTSYITIKIDETAEYKSTYEGVLINQKLEPTDQVVPAFTAVNRKKEDRNSGDGGNTLWGYKYETETLGSTTAGWADAGSYTSPLKLSTDKMLTYNFTVDDIDSSNDWSGLVINLTKTSSPQYMGDYDYLFLRTADWWYDILNGSGTAITSQNTYGDTKAKTVLKGSTGKLTVRRYGTKAIVQLDIVKDGTPYRLYHVQDLGTTDDIYVMLCGDRTQFTLTSANTAAYKLNGILLGDEDNNNGFGEGVRKDYIIQPNETLKFNFINYTKKFNDYNTWTLEIQQGDEIIDIGADNRGWTYPADGTWTGNGYWNAENQGWSNYDWSTFIDDSDGADVVLTIKREGTDVTMNAVHTSTSGNVFTKSYHFTVTSAEAAQAMSVRLLTDGGHLDLLSAEVGTTISAYDWSTFVTGNALDFSAVDGLTAYAVTGHDGTNINKVEVASAVPAGTPLLLNGDANTTYFIPVATTGTAPSGNLLQAGTGASVAPESGKTKYALSVEAGAAQFKKIEAARAIPVGKAFLVFNEDISAREFSLDGSATGIQHLKVGAEDHIYYDLQGRRVLYPKKGLYIVNGKKVVIK
ncbi:MAG: glycoside hydrolase family 43 protein [Prevotella sp.]|nr:glycoside hydrolase family 43 protein [Prevotella sp.]